MLPHSLTDFEIQRYCKNEPEFESSYSRKKLPNMIAGTAMVAIYINSNVTYFATTPKKCQTSTEE